MRNISSCAHRAHRMSSSSIEPTELSAQASCTMGERINLHFLSEEVCTLYILCEESSELMIMMFTPEGQAVSPAGACITVAQGITGQRCYAGKSTECLLGRPLALQGPNSHSRHQHFTNFGAVSVSSICHLIRCSFMRNILLVAFRSSPPFLGLL